MALLRTEHPADWVIAQAVVDRAQEIMRDRDKALAVEIANAVGRLFPK